MRAAALVIYDACRILTRPVWRARRDSLFRLPEQPCTFQNAHYLVRKNLMGDPIRRRPRYEYVAAVLHGRDDLSDILAHDSSEVIAGHGITYLGGYREPHPYAPTLEVYKGQVSGWIRLTPTINITVIAVASQPDLSGEPLRSGGGHILPSHPA